MRKTKIPSGACLPGLPMTVGRRNNVKEDADCSRAAFSFTSGNWRGKLHSQSDPEKFKRADWNASKDDCRKRERNDGHRSRCVKRTKLSGLSDSKTSQAAICRRSQFFLSYSGV